MIKIENVVLPSPEQWKAIIRGMRNPKNSWDRSDSYSTHIENPITENTAEFEFFLGDKDEALMKNLASGGPVHAKYRRMIPVYLDITRPLYWWKEFDTYKIGTVANSCSTMHKIHAKEFEINDFSWEHLINGVYPDSINDEHDFLEIEYEDKVEYISPVDILEEYIINALNLYREKYLEADNKRGHNDTHGGKDPEVRKQCIADMKKYWWQMIQLLPSSYNQKRTVMLNYEVLVNIYNSRRGHKLTEWADFIKFIETLPYSELITGEKYVDQYI